MIVDAHCHGGEGDGLTGPWDTRAPLGAYLRRAVRAGIGRTIVFAPFHTDYARANAAVAAIVRGRPDRFIGFACVHAERDRGRVRALVDVAVRAHGFRGIKVHRHDARITREVCEAALRFGLPVLYDPAGEIAPVELVAREYPALTIVVPHLGSFADDPVAQRSVIELLARYPNVYADTSGVRRFDLLVEAARRAPHKLVFGSDGPWLHPGLELAKVRALPLDPPARADALGGTILRLIGRPLRQRPVRLARVACAWAAPALSGTA